MPDFQPCVQPSNFQKTFKRYKSRNIQSMKTAILYQNNYFQLSNLNYYNIYPHGNERNGTYVSRYMCLLLMRIYNSCSIFGWKVGNGKKGQKMDLRPYQSSLICQIRAFFISNLFRVCAVLGCGGGKSVIAAHIAKLSTAKKNRVLFLVHRQELCDQIGKTFTACGVDMSRVHIAMVQTVTRHLRDEPKPELIIIDEAHHSTAESYTRILEYFPKAYVVGFTATPVRMGTGGLGKVYEALAESVSTRWLIENHYLAPYKYYSVKLADASELHTRHGEYIPAEVAELMERQKIYGDTVENYRKFADGMKTIVYCASIAASKATAEAFTDARILAAHLDGKTPDAERERTVNDFRDGRIQILCNVELFGEGFDVPDCDCVILLRPTKSLTVHVQQSMRSMRYKEGKTAIIIDHVANYTRHGLPDDTREWTLEERQRNEGENVVDVRECPHCFAVMDAKDVMCADGVRRCTHCGYVFETPTKREYEREQAELVQILAAKPYEEYREMKTFDELIQFQKAKGYKFAWVLHKAKELKIPIPAKYRYMMRFTA